MWLPLKKQKDVIARIRERHKDWKDHWDAIYKEFFADYRRMANGELPDAIATKLKGSDYTYNSKLIPRIVPDAIQYMKAIASNSLFNRDLVFEFTGLREQDPQRAVDANDLVSDEFNRTDFRNVAEQLIEDALEVGICFEEIRHWRDIRPVVKYRKKMFGRKELIRNSFETIFAGPRSYRLRPEMVYLDPDVRHPDQKPEYTKTMVLPISAIRHEANGLYKEYADNIKKIKPGDYDPTVVYEHDQQGDHRATNQAPPKKDEDFPTLYTESWYRYQNPETDIPVITCIGTANYNTKPHMIRYDIDPMLTGESPLKVGRIYPRNDRMTGECVPQKIRAYLLAKFYTRNQRIDLVNLARDVTGILFASGDFTEMDSMLTKRKRIIKMRAGLASDIKDIKLDTSAIPHLMNEEVLIDRDVEKTLATSRVAQGQTPAHRGTATEVHIINENSQIMSNYPLRQIEESIIKPAALGYLLHSQLLMPEEFKVRILGKYRSESWRDMSRADILGVFDVRCYGSSEILTKGVKQALMDKFVQTWSANPNVRIDWQGIAREHLKISEIPSAERYVPDTSFDVAYAERENGMLLNGIVVNAIEEDNHNIHKVTHLPIRDVAEETVMQAKKLGMKGQLIEATQILSNIEEHLKQHEMELQRIQGQINIGAGDQLPIAENEQKLLRNVESTTEVGVMSD